MVDIQLEKIDEVWIRVFGNSGIVQELADFLTFEVPNAKFHPKVRARIWDGKIRLLNTKTNMTYAGLSETIKAFAKDRGYTCESNFEETEEFSLSEAKEFSESLNLPFKAHDHQIKAVALAVRNHRGVLISPTASGKSLIIYLLTRYYDTRTLIIVPTISLVTQLTSDFADYGFDVESNIHKIYSGQEKQTNKQITISTWQSIFNQPKSYFKDFELVIGDEAHTFKAQSLTKIMTSLVNTKYRFGLTGTLDGSQVNELVLTGLFGSTYKIINTKELIDSGKLAALKVKVLTLNHPKDYCRKYTYQEELDHIVSFTPRNRFIRNLTLSLKGNTLVLFAYVEKHGKVLNDLIQERSEGRKVFYVHGKVGAEDREAVRHVVETESDAIIIASFGVFSTGINIKNIHNIIFASPTKSRIRTLQSIGRGLRVSDSKFSCTLFDIADNLSYNKNRNYTLNHLIERVKMYNVEQFPYDIHTIKLKDN